MCRRPRSRDWSCLFNAKMESIKLCKQKKAARTCCPRAGFKPGTLVLMNLFDKSRPHILQIVIGDPDLLSSDTTWGRLVRYCVDNGAYVCDPKPSLKKKATQTRQIFKRKWGHQICNVTVLYITIVYFQVDKSKLLVFLFVQMYIQFCYSIIRNSFPWLSRTNTAKLFVQTETAQIILHPLVRICKPQKLQ